MSVLLRGITKSTANLLLILSFAVTFLVISTNQLQASHLAAGNITWVCNGNGFYEVTLEVYRDCDGINLPQSFNVNAASASTGQQFSIALPLQQIGAVTIVCDSLAGLTRCDNPANPWPGYERYIYKGLLLFPSAAPDWLLSYSSCCRNPAIDNLNNTGNWYMEAMLNTTDFPCNSSPAFSNHVLPYYCTGDTVTYDHGGFDPEGDDFFFWLIDSYNNAGAPIGYSTDPGGPPMTGYVGWNPNPPNDVAPLIYASVVYPMIAPEAFYYDTLTGQIAFYTNAQQQSVINNRVTQRDANGRFISYQWREMQIVTLNDINCQNNNGVKVDTISNLLGAGLEDKTLVVCAGDTVSFTIVATDPDPSDSLELKTNIAQAIPDANFFVSGSNPLTVQFYWPTRLSDAGTYFINFTITDNACPFAKSQSATYKIVIPGAIVARDYYRICPGFSDTVRIDAALLGTDSLFKGTIRWTPNIGLSSDTVIRPLVILDQARTYVVRYEDTFCVSEDTVVFDDPWDIIAIPDSASYCAGPVQADVIWISPPAFTGICGPRNDACKFGTDQTIMIGDSTPPEVTRRLPFRGDAEDARSQVIYNAFDMRAVGFDEALITGMSMYVVQKNSTQPYNDFSIKIGCDSIPFWRTQSGGIPEPFRTGLSEVFSNDYSTNQGWNFFDFDIPYEYDGFSNLVLEFCFDNQTVTDWDNVLAEQISIAQPPSSYNATNQNIGCQLTPFQTAPRRPIVVFHYCVPADSISYSWTPTTGVSDPVLRNPTILPPNPGWHKVVAWDQFCELEDSIFLLDNFRTTFDSIADIQACPGQTIKLKVTGRHLNELIDVVWDPGLTNITGDSTFITAPAQDSTIIVMGFNNCDTIYQQVDIIIGSLGLFKDSINVSCSGNGMDGSITITPQGTGVFTYAWSGGLPGGIGANQQTGLAPGPYTVTVTEILSMCVGEAAITLTQSSGFSMDTIKTNPPCNGGVGSAIIPVTGGIAPFTFQWSHDGTKTDSIGTGLNPGPYTVWATDGNNCIDSISFTIIDPPAMVVTVDSTNTTCPTASDGTLNVTITNGTPPYTYVWSPAGPTGSNPTGLGTGLYSVTVTDGNMCTGVGTSQIIANINFIASASGTNVTCNGANDGTITVSTNSAGVFNYAWSPAGPTGATPTGLSPGIYTVTVSEPASGCSDTAQYTVTEPPLLTLALNATSNFNGFNVSCNGALDGSCAATVMGGSGAYTYTWSPNLGNVSNPMNLGAGTYYLTVTDTSNCTVMDSIVLNEPTEVIASASASTNYNGFNVSCNGGTDGGITVGVSGGAGGYTYAWTPTGSGASSANLAAGAYQIIVTDASGCKDTANITLSQPPAVQGTLAIDTAVSCNGASDGALLINPSGGVAPFTYTWNPILPNTNSPSGLASGVYFVTVTDTNGCQIFRNITLGQPMSLTATAATVQNVSCFGGADGEALITPAGGNGGFTYLWNPAGPVGANPNNLTQGTYYVTVSDVKGCTYEDSVTITEPPLFDVSLVGAAQSCDGNGDGFVIATPIGGAGGFNYAWSNFGPNSDTLKGLGNGTYSVTVTDMNNCTASDTITIQGAAPITSIINLDNPVSCFTGICDAQVSVAASGGVGAYTFLWSNSDIGPIADNLCPGWIKVTIIDAAGCTHEDSLNVIPPPPIDPGLPTFTAVSCFGGADGTATIFPVGGTPPYRYLWSNGDTTQTANNMPAGTFTVNIIDSRGCTHANLVTVTVTQPTAIDIQETHQAVSCAGDTNGVINLVVTGGTPGYNYSWPQDTLLNGPDAINLAPGSYTITVTDLNGCDDDITVNIASPQSVSTQFQVDEPSCFGASDGIITAINTQGGAGNYTFSLDGINYQGSPILLGVSSGLYTLYVKDQEGCVFQQPVTMTEPAQMLLDLGPDVTIRYGDSVQLNPMLSNGFGPFTYIWQPADTITLSCIDCPDPLAKPLGPTYYKLTVFDDNGCNVEDIIFVKVDKEQEVFVPNVFSPNEDGANDVFMIYGDQTIVNIPSFRVYDRWGEIVWEATNAQPNDPQYGWDGKLNGNFMQPAVFVYYVEIEFYDGTKNTYQGDVTLMR